MAQSRGVRWSGIFVSQCKQMLREWLRRKQRSFLKVRRQLDPRQWPGNSILICRKSWCLFPPWTGRNRPESEMQERKAPAEPPCGHSRLDASCWKQRTGGREENGNIFSLSVLSPHFSGRTRGKGSAENPQRKLEKHLMFPKLEKKNVWDANWLISPTCILSCLEFTKSYLREWFLLDCFQSCSLKKSKRLQTWSGNLTRNCWWTRIKMEEAE